jgi:hypothetical protein
MLKKDLLAGGGLHAIDFQRWAADQKNNGFARSFRALIQGEPGARDSAHLSRGVAARSEWNIDLKLQPREPDRAAETSSQNLDLVRGHPPTAPIRNRPRLLARICSSTQPV